MEQIWKNFDENSKATISELVKDNKKLNHLITKLQNARNAIDNRSKLMTALKQQVRK